MDNLCFDEKQVGYWPAFDEMWQHTKDIKDINFVETYGAEVIQKIMETVDGLTPDERVKNTLNILHQKAIHDGLLNFCPKYPPEFVQALQNSFPTFSFLTALNQNWYRVNLEEDRMGEHESSVRRVNTKTDNARVFRGYLVNGMYDMGDTIQVEHFTEAPIPVLKKKFTNRGTSSYHGSQYYHEIIIRNNDFFVDEHSELWRKNRRNQEHCNSLSGGKNVNTDDPDPFPPIPPQPRDELNCYNFLGNGGFEGVDGIYIDVSAVPNSHEIIDVYADVNHEGKTTCFQYYDVDHEYRDMLDINNEMIQNPRDYTGPLKKELGFDAVRNFQLTKEVVQGLFNSLYIVTLIKIEQQKLVKHVSFITNYDILGHQFHYGLIPSTLLKKNITIGLQQDLVLSR